MKEKLLSCPFCKEKKNVGLDRYRDGHWNVHCLMCGCNGPNEQSESKAIKAWNRRAK